MSYYNRFMKHLIEYNKNLSDIESFDIKLSYVDCRFLPLESIEFSFSYKENNLDEVLSMMKLAPEDLVEYGIIIFTDGSFAAAEWDDDEEQHDDEGLIYIRRYTL